MKKVILSLVISSLSVSSCFAMSATESRDLWKPTQNQRNVLCSQEDSSQEVWGRDPVLEDFSKSIKNLQKVNGYNCSEEDNVWNSNENNSVLTNSRVLNDLRKGYSSSSSPTVHENAGRAADTKLKPNTNDMIDPWNENNDQRREDLFSSSFLSDENAVDNEQNHTNNMIDPRNKNDDQSENSSFLSDEDAVDNEQELDTKVNNSDTDPTLGENDDPYDNPGRSRATAVRVALTGGVTVAVLAYFGWKVFGNSSRSEKTLFTKIAGKLGQNSGKASPVSIIFQFIKSKAEIVAPKLNRVLKKIASATGNAVYTGILDLPNIVERGIKISFEIIKYLIKQTAVLFGY